LVLALAFGVILAGALIVWLRPSDPVRLLHVGYADLGERGRAPLFCLTNGGKRAIAFVETFAGRPALNYKVRTQRGWEGPYPFRGTDGMPPSFLFGASTPQPPKVLQPGQSYTFQFARPLGPRGWKMGIAYRSCTVLPAPTNAPPPLTFANAVQSTLSSKQRIRSMSYSNIFFSVFPPSPASNVVFDRSISTRLHDTLPQSAPAWMKRSLKSMASDPVAWGPEMK